MTAPWGYSLHEALALAAPLGAGPLRVTTAVGEERLLPAAVRVGSDLLYIERP